LRVIWVNGGVVHGRCGFESLIFGVNGREFESLTFGVNGGVITIHKINKANQTPHKPSRQPSLFLFDFLISTKSSKSKEMRAKIKSIASSTSKRRGITAGPVTAE
jgi:hypothetical protein